MRELVFKNLTSEDKKKRDLYISDIVERNGIKTLTRRHSLYIISNRVRIKNIEDLIEWQLKVKNEDNKRHIFIFKARDTKLKKDSFICDVVGKLYTVVSDEILSISFKHSFEVDFVAQSANPQC